MLQPTSTANTIWARINGGSPIRHHQPDFYARPKIRNWCPVCGCWITQAGSDLQFTVQLIRFIFESAAAVHCSPLMAPTVEKHEKKKSSIRRLLSPVIFSSLGGNSSSSSSNHGRSESSFRRRKTEPVTGATSPSSSSSSPSTSLKYCKGRDTPPAANFRGSAGRAGSSVETAFVGTTPMERTRVATNADQSCQRTSYGIPRRIIQRRQSTSSCGAVNDEPRSQRAPIMPLYGSVTNRVATDIQDGVSHNNYEDPYGRTNSQWDPKNRVRITLLELWIWLSQPEISVSGFNG